MTRWERLLILCTLLIVTAMTVCTWVLLGEIRAESSGIMSDLERH